MGCNSVWLQYCHALYLYKCSGSIIHYNFKFTHFVVIGHLVTGLAIDFHWE